MKKRIVISFICLVVLLMLTIFLNLVIGSAEISLDSAVKIILSGDTGETSASIIWKIRIPRALSALLLGGGLSLSGYMLQTFFHNPIAGPFVLGISSGAKLTVSIVTITALSSSFAVNSAVLIATAFIGSMISLSFVLIISRKIKRMSMLVVCGIMIGYICSAVTDFIITFADDSDIVNLHNWSMGSFSGITMNNVFSIATVILPAFVLTFLLSKPIGAYQLGESYAQNLGVNIKFLQAALIILSGLLSACVTAFAGPVSFVGIAVPHILRAVFKTSKPIILIPACFLGGSIFCMLCDMLARTVFAPSELSISTVTAIFGAPVVIIAMLRRKKGEF